MAGSLPPGSKLELGEMALAVEGYAWPVIQFSPVTYRDTNTGAKVQMDALEVGFSPIRALIGQPGASVTIVGPHLQVNQDLFGPRLSSFEIVPRPEWRTIDRARAGGIDGVSRRWHRRRRHCCGLVASRWGADALRQRLADLQFEAAHRSILPGSSSRPNSGGSRD